jgi:hypothetical protein
VKLARHARELARLGFDLPGFEQVIDESSEVGSNEKHWREVLHDIQVNHQSGPDRVGFTKSARRSRNV